MRSKSRAFLIAAALTTSAITVAAAPVSAETGTTAQWYATVVDGTVVSTIDGSFTLAADLGTITVRDSSGAQIDSVPLAFELDGHGYPIHQQISADGRTLTLTPDPAARLGVQAVASPLEDQLAMGALSGDVRNGSLVGTIAGTVLGLLVGAAIGLGSCLFVGPACLVTAPAAIAAFLGVGGMAGSLIGGGGALASGFWKFLSTLQAAPGTSVYAHDDGLLDPEGTGVPDANLRLPPIKLPTGSGSGSGGK